jgi:hypothetical protein
MQTGIKTVEISKAVIDKRHKNKINNHIIDKFKRWENMDGKEFKENMEMFSKAVPVPYNEILHALGVPQGDPYKLFLEKIVVNKDVTKCAKYLKALKISKELKNWKDMSAEEFRDNIKWLDDNNSRYKIITREETLKVLGFADDKMLGLYLASIARLSKAADIQKFVNALKILSISQKVYGKFIENGNPLDALSELKLNSQEYIDKYKDICNMLDTKAQSGNITKDDAEKIKKYIAETSSITLNLTYTQSLSDDIKITKDHFKDLDPTNLNITVKVRVPKPGRFNSFLRFFGFNSGYNTKPYTLSSKEKENLKEALNSGQDFTLNLAQKENNEIVNSNKGQSRYGFIDGPVIPTGLVKQATGQILKMQQKNQSQTNQLQTNQSQTNQSQTITKINQMY